MVNYRITNILYAELRLLYKHQGLHKSILHNHVNSIMLKLNFYFPQIHLRTLTFQISKIQSIKDFKPLKIRSKVFRMPYQASN